MLAPSHHLHPLLALVRNRSLLRLHRPILSLNPVHRHFRRTHLAHNTKGHNMNRRSFMKDVATGGAVLAVAPAMLSMEGCTFSTSTLKSYLNTVLESAEKILALGSSTDSWYTTLSDAITALENTESSWNGSTAVTIVVSALDTLEAVLAVIPVTSAYSTLIDLLVSAIEVILTTFVKTSVTKVKVKALAQANQHRGVVPLKDPHFMQSKVGAYKSQWNDLATGLGLTKAKL